MTIYVLNKFEPNPYTSAREFDTTSRGQNKDLSPFYLGPYIWTDPTRGELRCERFENLWQYSKVYTKHTEPFTENPTIEFFNWQRIGFMKQRADRYPMGKGAKPLYTLWNGHRYGYIYALKVQYIRIYAHLVRQTETYKLLWDLVQEGHDIVLRDFDGYDYIREGASLDQAVNDPSRSMGHAFVLAIMLSSGIHV